MWKIVALNLLTQWMESINWNVPNTLQLLRKILDSSETLSRERNLRNFCITYRRSRLVKYFWKRVTRIISPADVHVWSIRCIALATKWLRTLSIPSNDKNRDHLVAKRISTRRQFIGIFFQRNYNVRNWRKTSTREPWDGDERKQPGREREITQEDIDSRWEQLEATHNDIVIIARILIRLLSRVVPSTWYLIN